MAVRQGVRRNAVGHTRLGTIPKTRKWREVVELVAGANGTVGASPGGSVSAIAAKTLDAAQTALDKAIEDPGVGYAFYLLTQVVLAARTSEWQDALTKQGIICRKRPALST